MDKKLVKKISNHCLFLNIFFWVMRMPYKGIGFTDMPKSIQIFYYLDYFFMVGWVIATCFYYFGGSIWDKQDYDE